MCEKCTHRPQTLIRPDVRLGSHGFVPHTLSNDGDPIDVLVANTRPIVPGAVINVRPVGVLKMEDEAGGDEKVIAVSVPKLTRTYLKIA